MNILHNEIHAKCQVIAHQNFTSITNRRRRYMAEILPIGVKHNPINQD